MKKIIVLIASIVSVSASAGINYNISQKDPNIKFNGKSFVTSIHDQFFQIKFDKDYATLKTPCYDAIGNYNISQKENGSYQVSFSLQKYDNVNNSCQDNAVSSDLARVALHTLNFNKEMNVSLDDNLSAKVDMYSNNGDIMTYNIL